MSTMILEVYEALKDAGVSDEKSKAAAQSVAGKENAAPRQDLAELRAYILEKLDLQTKWIVGTMVAMIGIFSAIVKIF